MSGDLVIEARGLVKRYGSVTAVNGIDLGIKRGEIFGLLGPNGAGKTTVILMTLGLSDRTSGTISVAGFDPARQPLEVKRRVGYMPDSVGFYENLTARANLRYSARLLGLDAKEADRRIADALKRVRLDGVVDRKVSTFSHGMRRRLGLADIWLKRAEVAILDEPTSGLDPQSTHELLDMIRLLKAEGIAVLVSSHLLERVQTVCDRVALFNLGRVALQGTVAELSRSVLGGDTIIDIETSGGGDLTAPLSRVPGVKKVTAGGSGNYRIFANGDIRGEIAAATVDSGSKLMRLALEEPSLDAIYTHYFEEKSRAA